MKGCFNITVKGISRKLLLFLCFLSLLLFISGCKKNQPKAKNKGKVELTYYKLFDNEEIIRPLIQEFESKNRNIKIHYKKFTDIEDYEKLVLNEIAEGEGPDIFEIHNTWLPRYMKKIYPMPSAVLSLKTFENTFVHVAYEDLVKNDPRDGAEKIFAIPLYVDTLGIYYNHAKYQQKVASRGKPPELWSDLEADVFKLTTRDNSEERFQTAGIALGRVDNILRASDILYMLFIQNKTKFYNDDYTKAIFSGQQGVTEKGTGRLPAVEALQFYISFALQNKKNYSWNMYISKKDSPEKEIIPFVKGKVVMIVGYSYLYEDLIRQIQIVKNSPKTVSVIDQKDIRTAPIPQMFINDKRAYASYFAETVNRNTKYPEEAWSFIKFLSQKESEMEYYEKTKRPSSRRDLIEEQKENPIYGVFAEQVGYARSIPQLDDRIYKEIFEKVIQYALSHPDKLDFALTTAEDEINKLIPASGLYPKFMPKKTVDKKKK